MGEQKKDLLLNVRREQEVELEVRGADGGEQITPPLELLPHPEREELTSTLLPGEQEQESIDDPHHVGPPHLELTISR